MKETYLSSIATKLHIHTAFFLTSGEAIWTACLGSTALALNTDLYDVVSCMFLLSKH